MGLLPGQPPPNPRKTHKDHLTKTVTCPGSRKRCSQGTGYEGTEPDCQKNSGDFGHRSGHGKKGEKEKKDKWEFYHEKHAADRLKANELRGE